MLVKVIFGTVAVFICIVLIKFFLVILQAIIEGLFGIELKKRKQ